VFWQIHRATIVNVQAIVGVSPTSPRQAVCAGQRPHQQAGSQSQLHASLQTDVAADLFESGRALRETRGLFGVRQGFLLF